MRQMGALILRASFVQLARSSFDIRFRLIAFLDASLALVRGLGLFSFQRGHAHFAFKQRVGFHRAAPAKNNSLHRDEFAVERCHREGGFIFLAGEGLVEFGENEDAAEQLANHRLNCTRCDDFINGPGQRTFGQTLADGFVSRSAKLRNKQRGLPELIFVNRPRISSALRASFNITACRFRPSAASIAGINLGSTSICATSEPMIASRKRSGSSKPLRTAREPWASPSPSALS